MTDGNSKKSKVFLFHTLDSTLLLLKDDFSFFLLFFVVLLENEIQHFASSNFWQFLDWFVCFVLVKLSWSKRMVRKFFNVKSKAEDSYQSNGVAYGGGCLCFVLFKNFTFYEWSSSTKIGYQHALASIQ